MIIDLLNNVLDEWLNQSCTLAKYSTIRLSGVVMGRKGDRSSLSEAFFFLYHTSFIIWLFMFKSVKIK